MAETVEHIAVNALNEIAKLEDDSGVLDGVTIARKALEQIVQLQSPSTVHHLSADDCVIDKPPGGGLL